MIEARLGELLTLSVGLCERGDVQVLFHRGVAATLRGGAGVRRGGADGLLSDGVGWWNKKKMVGNEVSRLFSEAKSVDLRASGEVNMNAYTIKNI